MRETHTAKLVSAADKKMINSIYFHGKLEEQVGDDRVHLAQGVLYLGINLVEVETEGELIDALAYIYDYKTIADRPYLRGVVVSATDAEAIEYAINAFTCKPAVL